MPSVDEIITQLQSDATDNNKKLLDELKKKIADKQNIPSKVCIDDVCLSRNELKLIREFFINTVMKEVIENATKDDQYSQYNNTPISEMPNNVIEVIIDQLKSIATDNLDTTDESQPPNSN